MHLAIVSVSQNSDRLFSDHIGERSHGDAAPWLSVKVFSLLPGAWKITIDRAANQDPNKMKSPIGMRCSCAARRERAAIGGHER